MFCPNCGNQLADGAKFCPKCGNQVDQTSVQKSSSSSERSTPAQNPSHIPTAALASAPAPVQSVPAPKKKPKVAIAIISVVVIAAIAVTVLVLTGVLGGSGQLSSIPAGEYRGENQVTYSDGGYVTNYVTLDADADGHVECHYGESTSGEQLLFSCNTNVAGSVGDSTLFRSTDIQEEADVGLLHVQEFEVLIPNGIVKGDPVGVWALQSVMYDDEGKTGAETLYFVVNADGTAIFGAQPSGLTETTFSDDPEKWSAFFSNLDTQESNAATWRSTGSMTYEITLNDSGSTFTVGFTPR